MLPTATLSFIARAAVAATCILSSGAAASALPPTAGAAAAAAESLAIRQISISFEELEALANDIVRVRGDINTNADQIKAASDALVAGWQGQGAAAYQEVLGRFVGDVHALSETMNDMAAVLVSGASTFQDAENENADRFG